MSGWEDRLLTSEEDIAALLRDARRIAVLGIKTEAQGHKPAFYVPQYMQRAGLEVVPVPVYYPDVEEILGERVYRRVADVPGPVDIVNVFRRPNDIPPHVPDIIEKDPACVWFQLGIRNDEAAKELAQAGIEVVQNRCIMVDHRRLA